MCLCLAAGKGRSVLWGDALRRHHVVLCSSNNRGEEMAYWLGGETWRQKRTGSKCCGNSWTKTHMLCALKSLLRWQWNHSAPLACLSDWHWGNIRACPLSLGGEGKVAETCVCAILWSHTNGHTRGTLPMFVHTEWLFLFTCSQTNSAVQMVDQRAREGSGRRQLLLESKWENKRAGLRGHKRGQINRCHLSCNSRVGCAPPLLHNVRTNDKCWCSPCPLPSTAGSHPIERMSCGENDIIWSLNEQMKSVALDAMRLNECLCVIHSPGGFTCKQLCDGLESQE